MRSLEGVINGMVGVNLLIVQIQNNMYIINIIYLGKEKKRKKAIGNSPL